MRRLMSNRLAVPAILSLLVVGLFFVMPSSFYLRVAALVWISALAVIGLNLLMGYAGQVSLGHAGFFGVGAYSVAILPAQFGLHPLVSLIVGALAAALLAFLVGRPILKLKGHYLAVATLGFGILVFMVIGNEAWLTGGPDGMPVPRLVLGDWRVRGGEAWYWITGALMVVGSWIAVNLVASPTGRALRALHDSEVAARVVGVDVARYKLIVFVISAVYASVAGSTLALVNGFITPDAAGFLHSIQLVTMVVLGGMGSVLGSVVGAAVLIVLPQVLTAFHDYEHLLLGFLMMAFMILLRAGIVPSLSAAFAGRRA
ncbi:branched-chain amino acid ABC transporter permease [Stappia sp. F7233]|uniref:Branched-chain amino acid ABC transporter permease n=1 Tax=Stappia albiluteola TaxID=2758565 RepID=A0A839AK10_9HYPH|nr:branched-chain amino acid ABC transporter permease [Stappia albiluteola]MBA5779406.1 branched-chain amino acid ABC transporter permease [Stappia albiluteola]